MCDEMRKKQHKNVLYKFSSREASISARHAVYGKTFVELLSYIFPDRNFYIDIWVYTYESGSSDNFLEIYFHRNGNFDNETSDLLSKELYHFNTKSDTEIKEFFVNVLISVERELYV